MHVLGLIYPVIITEQVCRSQILQYFTFLKIWEKNANFGIYKNNCQIILKICRCAFVFPLMLSVKFHTVSFAPRVYKEYIVSDSKFFWVV